MRSRPVRVGDCYEIPVGDRYAYCQYIAWNDLFGCMIQVFDALLDEPLTDIEGLARRGQMFPPVFTGLKAIAREGRWRFIGRLATPNFSFPTFRMNNATKPGEYNDWVLWDGKEQRFIGKLPQELRSLEFAAVWGSGLLEERIASGKNMYEEIR
jgi:hypothetical protein